MSMREEFERPMRWTDWRGVQYELTTEWWYVNGTAARRDGDGGTLTNARDANNDGMSPRDFMNRANEFIARRRLWQRGGVRLRLSVGADGDVSTRCDLGESDPEAQETAIGVDGSMLLPAKDAFLKLEEVLAVRLYTGPAYQPINAFLRTVGTLRGEARAALANDVNATFTATCKHLCRAIRKLSAVATADEVSAPLYRAVRGELPEKFWACPGELCATDTAFMSTSRACHLRGVFAPWQRGQLRCAWHPTPRPPSKCTDGASGAPSSAVGPISACSPNCGRGRGPLPPCTMLVISPAPEHLLERREKGRHFLEVTAQPCFI